MGANIKAIRARIKSVDSTRHITKAMELVASSKVKRAGAKMERSRFYRNIMLDAFADLAGEGGYYSVTRLRTLPALYIIVSGDRGLAGGYNNNIFRSSMTMLNPGDMVLPIGKRSVDYYKRQDKLKLVSDEFTSVENFSAEDSSKVAMLVKELYDSEAIGAVNLISTKFVSMLSQMPDIIYLLPLEILHEKRVGGEQRESFVPEYEPGPEEVLQAVIPEYISGVVFSSVAESYASELAARRSAMDTATKNADDMLDNLNLHYNRARQSAITQEITEIVAGANS